MQKTKICNTCNKSFPANSDYFFVNNRNKDKLGSRCKECRGHPYTNKLTKVDKGYKICNKCNEIKPQTEFNKSKNMKDGLRNQCKECQSKAYKEYHRANSDYLLKYNKEWKKKNKKHIAEYNKEYKKENAEVIRKQMLEYRKNNEDKIKNYAIKNRIQNNINTNNRRARIRKLPNTMTVKEWKHCKKHFDYRCAYCGKLEPLEQEHFIALTKDGEYTHNNIIPSCRSCNASKGNKDFFVWYKGYRYYSKKREQFILEYLGYVDNKVQQLSIL